MDWKTFISNVVGSLAWPGVATLFVLMVRKQLVPLLQRLEEVALPGGAKAKFYKDLREIREKVEELPGRKSTPMIPQFITEENDFLKLADAYPSAAILEAYKPIEQAINSYKLRYPDSKPRSPTVFVRQLFESQFVGDELTWLFDHVRSLRNRAAHAEDLQLTPAAALDYRDACLRVAGAIESAIQLVEEKSLIARTGYAGNTEPE